MVVQSYGIYSPPCVLHSQSLPHEQSPAGHYCGNFANVNQGKWYEDHKLKHTLKCIYTGADGWEKNALFELGVRREVQFEGHVCKLRSHISFRWSCIRTPIHSRGQ